MANLQTIGTKFLRILVDAGGAAVVTVRGVAGGWAVFVRVGLQADERVLALDRSSETRVFSSLDTVAGFLARAGVRAFSVDASTHAPVKAG